MMKIKLAKRFTKVFLATGLIVINLSCQSRAEKLYRLGQEKISQSKYLEAVDALEDSAKLEKNNNKWSKTNLEIAKALQYQIQDYSKAILVYRELILKSDNSLIRLQSQKAVSEIYFNNIQDYEAALKELQILEPLIEKSEAAEETKLKIAQSYKYLNQFKNSLEYIEASLKKNLKTPEAFLKLKAQVYNSLKRHDEALILYEEISKNYPTYFKKENLVVAQSLVYEEKKDYKAAIEYLNKNKNQIEDQVFFELRLKRLFEKQQNMPFSRGIRK